MNRRNLVFLCLVGASACSSSKTDGPTRLRPACTSRPARRREDGEGLVRTTFGDYPDRTPDWMRAGSVLSLLKQVWTRGKGANPGLPAKQVKMLDDAIAGGHGDPPPPIKKARSSRLTWWGSPCPNCSTISIRMRRSKSCGWTQSFDSSHRRSLRQGRRRHTGPHVAQDRLEQLQGCGGHARAAMPSRGRYCNGRPSTSTSHWPTPPLRSQPATR